MSRPLNMVASDQVFKKITARNGNTLTDIVKILAQLTTTIKSTKSYELDELWSNLEKNLYGKKSLTSKVTTDEGKLQTVFGLFYPALNHIDARAESTTELIEFRTLYYDTRRFVENRLLPKMTGKDKRNLSRVITTVNKRLDAVIERFNTRVDNKEITGPKL